MTTKKSIIQRLDNAVFGTEKDFYTEEQIEQFAAFYIDKWDEDTSEFVIAESFVDYWWCTDNPCRRCGVCGKLFKEGYCHNEGEKYYCSDECLHTDFSYEEWKRECKENEQSYYTEWY